MQKSAFTLIELVLVIVILGILAVLAIPVYQSLRIPAIESSEAAVMAAMKEAIYHKYSENIIQGSSEALAWPGVNPFTLLAQGPPDRSIQSSKIEGYWMRYNRGNFYLWYIYCPHWDGNALGTTYTKGRLYVYSYRGSYSNPTVEAGQIILYKDGGH